MIPKEKYFNEGGHEHISYWDMSVYHTVGECNSFRDFMRHRRDLQSPYASSYEQWLEHEEFLKVGDMAQRYRAINKTLKAHKPSPSNAFEKCLQELWDL